MFSSAFFVYTRPAVVCKNFSDFNSHLLFYSGRSYFLRAFIFQERSVCAPSRSLCMYWYLIPVSINQFLHQKCSYCLFPSIYPSLKLLVFLVKSQNLWNVLKSKHPHRITFEKSCGFIRVHSYRQGSKHPPGSLPVRHPQRPPSGRPVHHFQAHPMKDRQIPPCSPLSPLTLYPSLPS